MMGRGGMGKAHPSATLSVPMPVLLRKIRGLAAFRITTATNGSPTAGRCVATSAGSKAPDRAAIVGDEGGVAVVVERAPGGDRLGREAPVRERDREGAVRPEDAPDFGEHLDGARQVLHRDAAQRGVEGAVGVGECGVGVQALNRVLGQARVLGQLRSIHPEPGHAAELQVGREVAHPARHQVQDVVADREVLAVERGDGGLRAVVDVVDEPGPGVELAVVGLVGAAEGVGMVEQGGHGVAGWG